ncbi:hypothetical protein ACHAQA_003726 [Verticillium albo-atrum]
MTIPDLTLPLPRILCLHGGGVNAQVFALQARALTARLSPHFRLVFVDGPFLCAAHDAIVPVYGHLGPFRRWLPWLPTHPDLDAETAAAEIRYSLTTAMDADDRAGATGAWVGLLGFSQGAKIAASWLYTQQMLGGGAATGFRFAVLLAGRAPLVMLEEGIEVPPGVADASQRSCQFKGVPEGLAGDAHLLKLPTVHVHGLKDPGLELHRVMLRTYCQEGTTRLVEWDGNHRVPIKQGDVDAVVGEILDLGRELGLVKSVNGIDVRA